MEWNGINLNNQKQKNWRQKSISLINILFLLFFILATSAIFIYTQSLEIETQNQKLSDEIAEKENTLTHLNTQIAYRNQENIAKPALKSLKRSDIQQIFPFLQQLPLNGGLDTVQISVEESVNITLAGSLNSHTFENLEKQLNNQKRKYKIVSLQTNEHQQLAFNLLIKWEKENETVDR